MTTCPNCNDTRYLCGNEALGDCTCVTAANMRELDDKLSDAEQDYETRDAEISEATDALSAYLITLGHGARPLKSVGDTNLQRLVDVLGL